MRAEQKRRYYGQFRKNARRESKRWTAVEDARIMATDRSADRQLSKILGRTVQAIHQLRTYLKKARLDEKAKGK